MSATARSKRRFYHSIRFKLMLVALSLLLIPWAGYRYIQENELFLRTAQEDVLFGTAQAVAAMLRNQPELFISGSTSSSGSSGQFLYIHPLQSAIQLDGYIEDWNPYIHNTWRYSADNALAFDLLLAQDSLYIYLLLQAEDDHVVFREPGSHYSEGNDLVSLAVTHPNGDLNHYHISTTSPGWADVYRQVSTETGMVEYQTVTGIKGEWQSSPTGYNLELRIPRYLVADYLTLSVTDVDDATTRAIRARLSTAPVDSTELNRLLTPDPRMLETIQGIAHENARIWVVDRFQRVLARQGSLKATESVEEDEEHAPGILKMLFNLALQRPTEQFEDDYANRIQIQAPEIASALKGTPDTRRRSTPDNRAVILSTTWPIHASDGIVGSVLVEQTTNQILSLQNRAIEGLFGMTLLLFITTSLLLLGFATLLTGRVHRLRNRVEDAVTPDGRILNELPPEKARDEIGDLSRSFSNVLNRLKEYNRYLEAMTSRLAHELRTPLSVVRSSLDNLSQEESAEGQEKYITRAKEGVDRLAIILHRMREATRLEQLLQLTTHESFDLSQMLGIATESYRSAFPDMVFDLALPSKAVIISGSPDLISQALDKLISNAHDFHTPGTAVHLALKASGQATVELSISNQGDTLPQGMENSIFDSMVSLRDQKGDEPHLGLGLYLVRLICEYHGGHIAARNLSSPTGVEFIMTLPLAH